MLKNYIQSTVLTDRIHYFCSCAQFEILSLSNCIIRMKKVITLLSLFLLLGGAASAIKPDVGFKKSNSRVDRYIDGIFGQLRYKRGMKRMKAETFRRAYYGYLNLVEHGKVSNRRYLTVCDFSLSSNTKRLWLIDTRTKQVVINTLVAHGQRTGEEYARYFSNISESHQSSMGFFITKQTYSGHNGYSMRMAGMDGRWNSKAYSRDIVMHGADYVSHAYARANKRLGRSWGCPSVSRQMAAPIIDRIKNGSVLFIYHPTRNYLRTSFWLNNGIGRLPRNANTVIASNSVSKKVRDTESINMKKAEDFLEKEEPIIEEPKPVAIITEYKDPESIQAAKKDENMKVTKVAISAEDVTPDLKAKAQKKKKVVRKIMKINVLKNKDSKSDSDE